MTAVAGLSEGEMSPMKVLACPAQWLLSETFGSESTWAFKIMEECHNRFGIQYQAYCNWSDATRPVPGIEIVRLGHDEGKTLPRTARFAGKYLVAGARALRRSRFDIVHHMFPFGFEEGFNPLAVLNRIGDAAFVIGPIQFPQKLLHHSDLQLDLGLEEAHALLRQKMERAASQALQPFLTPLQEKTLGTADALVFDGRATQQLYAGRYPDLDGKSSTVIPHGIDTNEFRPRIPYEDRPQEIMTASYFTRRKGLDILVRAMPQVLESHPEIRLRACGEGPELLRARRLAEELHIRDRVIFQGLVPRRALSDYYSRARVYVQPSLSETLPLAVLEALACGTPAVATHVGLLGEYFQGSEFVDLVPAGDANALAEGIIKALRADGARRGRLARAYLERAHAWPVIAARWRDVYESVAK